MDISLFNPAVIYFSVSLPFDEIFDHTSSITAFAQAFDSVLVVIIQGGGRTAVDWWCCGSRGTRTFGATAAVKGGRPPPPLLRLVVLGSRNLDSALLCLPFLQSRQCLLAVGSR